MQHSDSVENDHKQEILAQVQAALDYVPTDPKKRTEMVGFFRWQMRQFLDPVEGVGPEDSTPHELAALVALLGPAFMRRLGGKPPLTAPVRLRAI